MKTPRFPRQRGLSLAELLAVIVILGITAALMFSVFAKAKAKAKEPPCASNLRQIGIALELYRGDANGEYPLFFSDLAAASPDIKPALVCPADVGTGANGFETVRTKTKASVFYWPPYPEGFREAILAADPGHGVAFCVLHGRHLPSTGTDDPRLNTTGLVVRLSSDGSIKRAHVGFHCGKLSDGSTLTMRTQWSLLTDAPCVLGEFCDNVKEPCSDPREEK